MRRERWTLRAKTKELSTLWLGLAWVFGAARAGAYDARVEASLDTQFYAVQSPFGEPYTYRRRYTSTLGLELYDLQGNFDRRGPRLEFRSRLRLDADFGKSAAERTPDSNHFVPGLEIAPLDVMYAYFEGRGFCSGLCGFRVGRQYLVDALGYWSFDGALARVSLPIHVELSGFVGLEQRTGVPMLATARFTSDGVYRGNRYGLELTQQPAFLDDSALAPAFGAAIETHGMDVLHSRVSYRRVENRSTVLISPFLGPGGQSYVVAGGARTSSERLGYSGRLDLPKLGALSGRGVYDLYTQVVAEANLGLDVYASRRLGFGAELDYDFPTFDGDSIFNWFSHRGMTTALARASVANLGPVDAALSLGMRWFQTEGDPVEFAEPDHDSDRPIHTEGKLLSRANARYRLPAASLSLDALLERGPNEHVVGSDLGLRKLFQGGRYDSLAILSLYDWTNSLRPTRSATSFTYVLGAGLYPGPGLFSRGRFGFEWEHTLNRLVGQRVRLLLTLDLTVLE